MSGSASTEQGSLASLAGRFFVLDGPDGSGKTTQQTRLREHLESCGLEVVCCRDPGGTQIGDRIRSVLLDYDLEKMNVRCETLLFMASRAQLCHELIQPALEAGCVVLCDRFVSATCAYQGAAGFDSRKIIELAWHAIGDLWPHLTIIVDVPTDVAFERLGRTVARSAKVDRDKGQTVLFPDAVPDAIETRPQSYHSRVRENFLELPGYYPTPVAVVDGSKDSDTVFAEVLQAVVMHA